MKLAYRRLLVKISGEQLAGSGEIGFDANVVQQIADELRAVTATGAEVVVMVGGGNYVRGALVTGSGLHRVTADYMGMLATLINATAVADIFNSHELPAKALTNIYADQVADQYTQRRAVHHLGKKRVVVVGGGIGRPYLTTDTAAVSLALELECDVVCKITKVDGVYTQDPTLHAEAIKYEKISFQEAVENSNVRVMDKAALGLAMEFEKPIVVCDLATPGNLAKLVEGKMVGTLIR